MDTRACLPLYICSVSCLLTLSFILVRLPLNTHIIRALSLFRPSLSFIASFCYLFISSNRFDWLYPLSRGKTSIATEVEITPSQRHRYNGFEVSKNTWRSLAPQLPRVRLAATLKLRLYMHLFIIYKHLLFIHLILYQITASDSPLRLCRRERETAGACVKKFLSSALK